MSPWNLLTRTLSRGKKEWRLGRDTTPCRHAFCSVSTHGLFQCMFSFSAKSNYYVGNAYTRRIDTCKTLYTVSMYALISSKTGHKKTQRLQRSNVSAKMSFWSIRGFYCQSNGDKASFFFFFFFLLLLPPKGKNNNCQRDKATVLKILSRVVEFYRRSVGRFNS